MFHFGRANAMRQRPESPMRGRMRIAADHGHARQGPALFGADDMHDALTDIRHRIVVDPEVARVPVQRLDLNAAFFIVDMGVASGGGGHVMVRNRDGLFRCAHRSPGHPQPFKGLGAGHLMHKVAVDVQKAGAVIGLVDDMGIPDLVVKRFRRHGCFPEEKVKNMERRGNRSRQPRARTETVAP